MPKKVTVNGHETLTQQFFGVLVLAVLGGWLLDSTLLRQPTASNPIVTAGKVRYFTPSSTKSAS
jgi:hypothetical protein